MSAKLEYGNGNIRVRFTGEIDHHAASLLRVSIDSAIAQHRPKTLILDFSGVTFMDSSGVGLVMGRYRSVSAYGGKVEAVNLPPRLYQIMKLSGLEKIAGLRMAGERP